MKLNEIKNDLQLLWPIATRKQLSEYFGICDNTLWRYSKKLNLPNRKSGTKKIFTISTFNELQPGEYFLYLKNNIKIKISECDDKYICFIDDNNDIKCLSNKDTVRLYFATIAITLNDMFPYTRFLILDEETYYKSHELLSLLFKRITLLEEIDEGKRFSIDNKQ